MNRKELLEIIFQNIGSASMCWSQYPKGEFNSELATKLGYEIVNAIDKYIEEQIEINNKNK
jgi:hypothetical protein